MSNYIDVNVAIGKESGESITQEEMIDLTEKVIRVLVDNGYEMGGSWTLREGASDETQ